MTIQEHPLWPTLKKWAENSPSQIVPWAPRHEFQQNVDRAILANPIWGHEVGNAFFWQTHEEAAALGKALVGGPYNINAHAMLYRVSVHPLGRALCRAAWVANSFPSVWDDFATSTQLDGFVRALEAWASHFVQEGFDGMEELPWVIKNVVGTDESEADFWLTACQQGFGDKVEYTKAVAREVGKTNAAARMRKRPKKKTRISEFKDWLRVHWVPAALWSKSNAEIVSILAPDRKENMTAAYDRVRRDIFELGFTSSRRKPS